MGGLYVNTNDRVLVLRYATALLIALQLYGNTRLM